MDVKFVVAILLCTGGVLTQTTATDSNKSTTTNTPGTDVKCKTGMGLEGSCVPRRLCDYGTVAIDKSLYAPSGFKNPCRTSGTPDDLVNICCPFNSQVADKPSTKEPWRNDNDIDITF